MKKRIYELDNLKAILIFLVVLGHLLISFTHDTCETAKYLSSFIYSFHMPLFIIISGYFSKKEITKAYILKLLLIFIIMNISFSFYDYIITGSFELLSIKYASWYILLILLYRLLLSTKIIQKILKEKTTELILFSFFISIFIPIIRIDLFILRLFENFIYFITGYLISSKKLFNLKINKNYLFIATIFFIFIDLYISIIYHYNLDFFLGNSYILKQEMLAKSILILSNISLFIVLKIIISNKEIPIITNLGKNSLYIYMLHRIPTLILTDLFIVDNKVIILLDIVFALLLCLLLSSKLIIKVIDIIINKIINGLLKKNIILIIVLIVLLIILILFDLYTKSIIKPQNHIKKDEITIGFVGDLILLEDQVNLSKSTFGYDFDYMFNYTKKIINKDDYTIGVFEGTSDDHNTYSTGNYIDNKELRLNYPGKFINSIKKSGIDLVTTANNHVYDKGYYSAINTMKNLRNRGLDFVGTSTNNYPERKIVTNNGIKIGVLAYTYNSNYPNNTKNKDIVKFLVNPDSKHYEETKQSIKEDFDYLKDKKVDLIVVLPHYGEEFNFAFTKYQDEWNKVFSDLGANIIFGDHSHVIGPIKKYNKTLAISSPGNYVNSYNGQDSDISTYIKVTINKNKKIKQVKVIPLLAIKEDKGYYPISLYDLNKKDKKNKRVKEALKIFGKVVLNNKDIKLKKEYKVTNFNIQDYPLELVEKDKESTIYKLINNSNKICFIGDSITKGSVNHHHPWFEPLMENFDKEIINISDGSYTSSNILEDYSNKISNSNCDLSIINIGTNDIRYNKFNPVDYQKNIKKIMKLNKTSKYILLSPWETYSEDRVIGEDIVEKKDLYGKYNSKLIALSKKSKDIYYVNTNRYIKSHVYYEGERYYLLDGVHPNKDQGIKLYSYSILRGIEY